MSIQNNDKKGWGYVIYHKSGTLLFENEKITTPEEKVVLANLVSTLLKSAQKNTTIPIEELEMSGTTILLSKSDGLPIWHGVFVNKSQNKNVGYKLLGNLIDQFDKLYEEAQQKKIVANFFKYQKFSNYVLEIFESIEDKPVPNPMNESFDIVDKKDSIVT